MSWSNNELKFCVYLKQNQQLKYLNRGSAHISATFKSIPHGVIKRLATVTSLTQETKDNTINKLYPAYTKALELAGLPTTKNYPTLHDAIRKLEENQQANNDNQGTEKAKHKRERDRK